MVGLCETEVGAMEYWENWMFSPVLNIVFSKLCMVQPTLNLDIQTRKMQNPEQGDLQSKP